MAPGQRHGTASASIRDPGRHAWYRTIRTVLRYMYTPRCTSESQPLVHVLSYMTCSSAADADSQHAVVRQRKLAHENLAGAKTLDRALDQLSTKSGTVSETGRLRGLKAPGRKPAGSQLAKNGMRCWLSVFAP